MALGKKKMRKRGRHQTKQT